MTLPQPASRDGSRLTLCAGEMVVVPAGVATRPDQLAALPVEWLPTRLPGTAMSALFDARRACFTQLPALDDYDIWYRGTFHTPFSQGHAHRLCFEGLATLAEAWLNGQLILVSDNMFQSHAVDVSALLAPHDNVLLMRFASLSMALKARRPRPRWRTRLVEQQQLRWFRSSLLGRIPGWTPATPAIGPWRPIHLQTEHHWRLGSTVLRSEWRDGAASLHVQVELHSLNAATALPQLELHIGDEHHVLQGQAVENGRWQFAACVPVTGAQAWWPHTHGEQPLSAVSIVLNGETLLQGRTGFRQITLDSADDGFALRINGVPVFCRGACWTPTDILTLTDSADRCREALLLAREAGMNMLRISGTLFYEASHFYMLCDELGILVWQDWMFANMDYPADDAGFMASVQTEAQQFLQRTQLSPCLALLCGNSEVEQQAAMLGLEQPLWRNRLFAEVLPAIGAALRPDVPYWPSSPAGGVLPFQVDAGAAHYFGVGAYLQPLTDARRCGVRFTSECLAFANVPEPETLDLLLADGQSPLHHPLWKARVPRDNGSGWDFDDVRDHYLTQLFKVDPVRLRYADMDRYLALSRVVTGEVMAAAFAEWRRAGSSCAGGLVWFLRDLWPGAGWGVIDATGLPKAAWHYLRRALASVTLCITHEGVNGLALHAINESAATLDVQLSLTLYRHGEQVVATGSTALTLGARSVIERRGDGLLGHFMDTTHTYRFGPPGHDLACAVLTDARTGAELGRDFFFPLGHDFAVQSELGLAVQTAAEPDGCVRVTVSSRRFAQAVRIDCPGYRPTHNYFHLAPGASQTTTLWPRKPGVTLRGSVGALNTSQRLKLIA